MKVLKLSMLIAFMLLNYSVISAQSFWYRTTEFSYKCKKYNKWTEWSDWENSNIKMEIDFDNEIITIFSNGLQKYYVLGQVEAPYDPNGEQIKLKIVDQNRNYGFIRLRVDNEGNNQVYVDFDNLRWVYNVVRIR